MEHLQYALNTYDDLGELLDAVEEDLLRLSEMDQLKQACRFARNYCRLFVGRVIRPKEDEMIVSLIFYALELYAMLSQIAFSLTYESTSATYDGYSINLPVDKADARIRIEMARLHDDLIDNLKTIKKDSVRREEISPSQIDGLIGAIEYFFTTLPGAGEDKYLPKLQGQLDRLRGIVIR